MCYTQCIPYSFCVQQVFFTNDNENKKAMKTNIFRKKHQITSFKNTLWVKIQTDITPILSINTPIGAVRSVNFNFGVLPYREKLCIHIEHGI